MLLYLLYTWPLLLLSQGGRRAIGLVGLIALSPVDLLHSSSRFHVALSAMNGFNEKGLNEDAFGEKANVSGLMTFDAFRES